MPPKPPDPAMYLYEGQDFDPKKRVDTWMRMDVLPL